MSFLRGDATILGGSIDNTPIGEATAATGRFTTVESTVSTGTAPFIVASQTLVANLYAYKTSALRSLTTDVVVSGADAPTNGQVLTATSGTTAIWQTPPSSSFKPPVTAASTANVVLNDVDAGYVLDGVTLAINDLVLIKDQTTGSENGIYLVNADTNPPTRASIMPAGSSAGGVFVTVQEGTQNADKFFLCTNDPPTDVVGTDALAWMTFGYASSGRVGGQTLNGGVGTGENMYLQGNPTLDGSVYVNDTTQSTSKDTGALIVEGGVGIEKNLYVGGDANIAGDLTVTGDIIQTGAVAESYESLSVAIAANSNPALTKTVSYVALTGTGGGTSTGTLSNGTVTGTLKRVIMSSMVQDGREVTTFSTPGGGSINNSGWFEIYRPNVASPYKVWYNVNGAGVAPSGNYLIQVAINNTDASTVVASATASAINATYGFTASASSSTVTVVNDVAGNVTNAAEGSSPSGITTFTVASPGNSGRFYDLTVSSYVPASGAVANVTTLRFSRAGQAVSLSWDGSAWVCINSGAEVVLS